MNFLMLRFIAASLFLFPANIFAQKNKTVTIEGTLKNFNNQVVIEDHSEMHYLLPPDKERVIVPDSNGGFKIRFDIDSPNYFRIGRNILYLSPGDNLNVFIDKEDPRSSDFKGKGSEANLYLRKTPYPKGGSFLEAGRKIQPDTRATIDTVLKTAQQRQVALKGLTGVSSEFKRLESARIKADIINSFNKIRTYGPSRLKLKGDTAKQYVKEYEALIAPLTMQYSKSFLDPTLLKVEVYRDIVSILIKQPAKEINKQQIEDWMKASDLVREMNKINDKEQLASFSDKIASIKTLTYKKALNKSLANSLAFGKGDSAIDFTAVDLNGNNVLLSSLKGKVIYVDLWATWCGPCMVEMPYFEKLKEHYKDNSDVAFVSLSIDDGAELWKSSVQKRNANGIQWLINRNKLSAYNIVGIPRTLIIDKDFKMVEMNAPVPSSKESEKIINSLLN
jgi:thiol-disulfide isomerase/thioredoxin